MTTHYGDCQPGDRFDCYYEKDDLSKEWLYRVVADKDDRYVYLQEPNKPVDVRVDRNTQVVYQWLYGGWETSKFQQKSAAAGYITIRFGFQEEDFEDTCNLEVFGSFLDD